jgi:hypothetical protein
MVPIATVRVLDRNGLQHYFSENYFFLGAILFAFVFAFGIVYLFFQMDKNP